jgi:predicted transglutaminase-like protease
MTQSEINIAIGAKDPDKYFAEIIKQIETGKLKYGGIKDETELKKNFEENCIPTAMLESDVMNYEDFLKDRRVLMAMKMKRYFQSLGEVEMEQE